jgi:tRNA A-37 threonylcarbamoyl transferase component Bud32
MQKGSLLAEGRSAEVYAWGEDKVLKLYRSGFPPGVAEYEYCKALASQEIGFAVPAIGELVSVDGRAGITYQRVEGPTMLQALRKVPWKLFPLSLQLAALQVDMHNRRVTNLPVSHDVLARKIQNASPLDQSTQNAILYHLSQLPQSNKLLHGDFHPNNILLSKDGPVIIDWIDATMGHPMADVARTSLITRIALPPPSTLLEHMTLLMSRLFHLIYINHYFKLSPFNKADLKPWLLPVTAGRLSEEIPHEIEVLVRLV